MAIFNFYFTSCLLLLASSWCTSTGIPLRTLSPEQCDRCSQLFKSLLLNITDLLSNDVLCFGITSDKVVLRSKAETVLACAPTQTQNSGCMIQRNTPFSESECLGNIMKDLAYYSAAFQSYLDSEIRRPEEERALLMPTLGIIQSLQETCSLTPNGENSSSEADAAQMWGNDSFTNRQEMCKMMRGFHLRTITINRAMGYISSGDHKQ